AGTAGRTLEVVEAGPGRAGPGEAGLVEAHGVQCSAATTAATHAGSGISSNGATHGAPSATHIRRAARSIATDASVARRSLTGRPGTSWAQTESGALACDASAARTAASVAGADASAARTSGSRRRLPGYSRGTRSVPACGSTRQWLVWASNPRAPGPTAARPPGVSSNAIAAPGVPTVTV